jgi:hypothetical protein
MENDRSDTASMVQRCYVSPKEYHETQRPLSRPRFEDIPRRDDDYKQRSLLLENAKYPNVREFDTNRVPRFTQHHYDIPHDDFLEYQRNDLRPRSSVCLHCGQCTDMPYRPKKKLMSANPKKSPRINQKGKQKHVAARHRKPKK